MTAAGNDESPAALPPGAAIYSRALLAVYDAYVLGFSNRCAWRCASRHILALYDRRVSACHLEVGAGTGYFPDHCRFPVADPRIDLLDIHPETLTKAARRLARYRPRSYRANVLEPLGLPRPGSGYGSIAANYLLHCLPGPIRDKGRVLFDHLLPLLDPAGGCLFGSTILGLGVAHNALGRRLMALYNHKGIFGNSADDEADLRRLLEGYFPYSHVTVRGCVALFSGSTRPMVEP